MSTPIIPCEHHQSINCVKRSKCARCGWYPIEHAVRVYAIRNGGMVQDKDGLKRLHVKTKEDDEFDAD